MAGLKTVIARGLLLCGYFHHVIASFEYSATYSVQPGQDLLDNGSSMSPSPSKFVLVLDNSNTMASCNRMENLKTNMKRWVDGLKPGTKVAIVKYGTSNQCATGSGSMTKDCYITISDHYYGEAEKRELRTAIDRMASNMGNNYMSEALQSAYTIMKDEHDAYLGQPGVLMLVTDGMANGPGPAIDDQQIWGPFQQDHIRVITLNLGAEIDTKMKYLVTETGGKAFVSKSCAGFEDDAFQYASETFIPSYVGDNAMKEITTSQEMVPGIEMLNRCSQTNDGKQCFKHSFTVEKSLNTDVTIYMRGILSGQEIDITEFMNTLEVRMEKTSLAIDGFVFSENGGFTYPGNLPEEYTEKILDVYLTPADQSLNNFCRTTVMFTTTAKRTFDAYADYYVTCDHPAVMETDKEFKIESKVLRGNTPIDHANVVARVHVSRESDPNAETPPMFCALMDDGNTAVSGDEHKNDGTYTTTLYPEQLHLEDGMGISVMCNLVESPGAEWNDNNFFG